MAYFPPTGSVVAFQSDPTKLLVFASVSGAVTAQAGSVMTVATLAGSVMATSAISPAGSITSVTIPAGSITAVSATAPAGSVMATSQVAGSVMAVSATQGTTPWLIGSVYGNISGSVVATISGTPNVNTAGSVVAFQGTTPWLVNQGGSVITVSKDSSVIALQLAGSILAVSATLTPAANQSVSGEVNVVQTTSPWLTNQGGSVVAVLQTSSIIARVTGSVATLGVAGSIASVTNPAGSVTAVLATQVTSPWIVAPNNSSLYSLQLAGSIMAVNATLTPPANQSVSGEVNVIQTTSPWLTNMGGSVIAVLQTSSIIARVTGSVATLGIAGSIMSVTNPAGSVTTVIATFPAGSVASFTTPAGSTMAVLATQVTSPWVVTSSNTSIVGTYQEETVGGPSIKGIALVWESNANTSVMSTVSPTNPLRISGSVSGRVETTQPAGSLMTVITPAGSIMQVAGATTTTAGSVLSVTIPAGSITAVSATAPAGSIMATNQVAGSVMAVATGSVAAWLQSNNSSIIAVVSAGAISVGSVSGAVTAPPGSIMSVTATQPAGSLLSAIQVAGSIMAVSATQITSPWIVAPNNSSMFALQVSGSVQAIRIDNVSVITVVQSSSILSVPVGSTIVIQQANSIVGTYAEDAASASADKGVFVLAARNDTMASVTGSDGDYSGFAVGPVGEVIVANSPITKWVSAQTSVMSGPSVLVIAGGGASIFTYITGIQIANDGAVFARVKFTGGLGSVLAWSVAPANGGSNIVFPNPLRTGDNSGFSASVNAHSSVYVSAQGFISKI